MIARGPVVEDRGTQCHKCSAGWELGCEHPEDDGLGVAGRALMPKVGWRSLEAQPFVEGR